MAIKHSELFNIAQRLGISIGSNALVDSGIQHEFAAHLAQMSYGSGASLVLRSGSAPKFDRAGIAAKPGYIRSKSSKNQGFFNGWLSAHHQFTRVETDSATGRVAVRGIHEKDVERLALPKTDVDCLHSVPLYVSIKEINDEISASGDLQVKSFNPVTGELKFQFKQGKGSPDFQGIFVVYLSDSAEYSKEYEPSFVRPWTKAKSFEQEVNNLSQVEELKAVDFKALANKEFKLFYKDQDVLTAELMPAEVLARTPMLHSELIELLEIEGHELLDELRELSIQASLERLGGAEITRLYEKYGRIITGDWDGLVLGHPIGAATEYLAPFNSFAVTTNTFEDILNFVNNCKYILEQYKEIASAKEVHTRTRFDQLVLDIDFDYDLLEEFAFNRAGVITPFEFLYQQLSNYAYRQKLNTVFGEKIPELGLVSIVKEVVERVKQLKYAPSVNEKKELIALAVTRLSGREQFKKLNVFTQSKIEAQLKNILEQNLSEDKILGFCELDTTDEISNLFVHPDYDSNIDNLFQHGFDMRNPYGIEADGPWLMISNSGVILRGTNQQQLIAVLLADNGQLLQNTYFPINYQIDMAKDSVTGLGWCDIVRKQLELGHPVDEKTIQSFITYLKIEELVKIFETDELSSDLPLESEVYTKLHEIIETRDTHKQLIPVNLIEVAVKHKAQQAQTAVSVAGARELVVLSYTSSSACGNMDCIRNTADLAGLHEQMVAITVGGQR